jgi:tetratricopeptide (TPR) repeat protein
MSWGRALCVLALLLGGGVLHAAPKAAPRSDRDKARTAYLAGTKHYNLGEYREALDSFKDAYRAYEEPTFLFNIAQCQRMLDNKVEAIRSYRAYLRAAPDANHAEVDPLIAQLEQALRDEQAARHPPPVVEKPVAKPVEKPVVAIPPPVTISTKPTVAEKPVETPAYKKWWVWTLVVVVVGGAVGLGVGLTQTGSVTYPAANPNAGTVRF